MEYAMSSGGLLVHARQDWPCALCRPRTTSDRLGLFLCVGCAYRLIAAAESGHGGARVLLNDITDALALLESPEPETTLAAN